MQVTKEESDNLLKQKKVGPVGYHYTDDNGNYMVEYNVHDSEEFDAVREKEKYGGRLSVRFPRGEKPVIFIGQDETAFKQGNGGHVMSDVTCGHSELVYYCPMCEASCCRNCLMGGACTFCILLTVDTQMAYGA